MRLGSMSGRLYMKVAFSALLVACSGDAASESDTMFFPHEHAFVQYLEFLPDRSSGFEVSAWLDDGRLQIGVGPPNRLEFCDDSLSAEDLETGRQLFAIDLVRQYIQEVDAGLTSAERSAELNLMVPTTETLVTDPPSPSVDASDGAAYLDLPSPITDAVAVADAQQFMLRLRDGYCAPAP
jgi:hypothetical protein